MKWYRKKHQAGLDGDPFKEQLPAKNLKEAYERTKELAKSIFKTEQNEVK